MKIELTISEAQKNRAIAALCKNYGYEETIDDKPNPETKNAFAKKQIIEFIKNHVKAYETKVEQEKISVPDDISIT